MMQATDPWYRYNPSDPSCPASNFPARWRPFVQAEMSSVVVIVANVLIHEPLEMALIEDDHMIKKIAATGADGSFSHAVLPRALEIGSLRFDAEALNDLDDYLAEI